MENKIQLTLNSMNSISGGAVIYGKGDAVDSISLLVKGRVEASAEGISTILASGNFLGVFDVGGGVHEFTYTAKEDAVVLALPVNGTESIQNLLKVKPEYCGLLVTSLNFFIVELKRRITQMRKENKELADFMSEKYELCSEVAKNLLIDVPTEDSMEKVLRYSEEESQLPEKAEYYFQCASFPVDVQKKYFGGSSYVAFFHYQEQCEIIRSIIQSCTFYVDVLYKQFRGLILDESSLFQTIGRLALSVAESGERNAMVDRAVDEIVEKINDIERFLTEKAGMDIALDRERMEKLYFALLSGESAVQEEMDELDHPGIEYLHNSLEQITEYAPVHLKVKSEFIEQVETFAALNDKFEKTPETTALRKEITQGFFEIYEAVLLRGFEDKAMPLAVRLFLDFGFVSEKLLTEDELQNIVSLRPKSYSDENGCRVYSMRQWLKAIYDGVKDTSKNEYDLDFEQHLRQLAKEGKIEKKEIPEELADKEKRLHFECQNMFRYADRVVNGNISTFVPILFSDGIFNNIPKAYMTEDKINQAVNNVEQVDYSLFYRDRMVTYEKIDVSKAVAIDRIPPDFILFPIYGRNGIMWQDVTGRRRNTKGRILMPILYEKDTNTEMIRLLASFRWEKCRTDLGNRWNDFRYPSLTSEYTDYLQFYRKNTELSQERKTKIRGQLQQCNGKHKEVFIRDYLDWILRESRGAMKLSRVARNILFTYCPFSREVTKTLEGQTLYADAAKRYNRDNRSAIKNIEMMIRKFERSGMEIPEEIQNTCNYLKG